MPRSSRAREPLKSRHLESVVRDTWSHGNKKPRGRNERAAPRGRNERAAPVASTREQPPVAAKREKPLNSNEDPVQPKTRVHGSLKKFL